MKKVISFVLSLILILLNFNTAYSHSKDEHYKEFEQVFFNDYRYSKKLKASDPKRKAVEILENACTICIDQFGNNEQKNLEKLRKNWLVPSIPNSVAKINPPKNQTQLNGHTHRAYTHRGWNYDYGKDDKANWPVRKNILLASVNKVFDFKPLSGKILVFDLDYLPKCDSFCAIAYYVHILGDYIEDNNVDKFNGDSNGKKIPFASTDPSRNADIFSELLYHIAILFEGQKDKDDYKVLINQIEKIAEESRLLVEDKEGTIIEDNFDAIKKQVSKLMFLLEGLDENDNETKNYFYELISQEEFFKNVFSP